ncbi:hypothetical protein AB3480_06530 [Rhizobium mongolense]|uniref:hypothetical protein n=1 Tax=Rhizobium mongolense TaxID=57676 RepID=UPI0034A24B77
MTYLPIATVEYEGGLYRPGRNTSHPIRIYPDRWIEDDIAAKYTGSKRRQRLSRRDFRTVMRAAKQNRREGRV